MKSNSKKSIEQDTFTRREFGKIAGAMSIAVGAPPLFAQTAAAQTAQPKPWEPYWTRLKSIRNFQTRNGHRETWSDFYGDCAEWILGEFPSQFNKPALPTRVDVTDRGQTFNVVVELPAKGTPEQMPHYVLCAHLDTFDEIVPGANDNASGVAAVLELAQAIANLPIRKHPLICILAGAEEKQLAGSLNYCETTFAGMSDPEKAANYRVINIDTVSGKKFNSQSDDFYLQWDSSLTPSLKDGLVQSNVDLTTGQPILALKEVILPGDPGTSPLLSDHVSFALSKVPSVSISQFERDNNAHTPRDGFGDPTNPNDYGNLVPANGYSVVDWVYKFLKKEMEP